MQVSIGITAYNEEANIGRLLAALQDQVQDVCRIRDIVVVASGCTDKTVSIACEWAKIDPRIKLIEQPERQGKASAVNLFIQAAQGEILILESADTLPASDTCEQLVKPFLNPDIGMSGAHPVPLNDPHNFIGYAAHFLWGLHHKLALTSPKLGEMVAFRNLIRQIPPDTAVDEAAIEALLTQRGLKLAYVPDALVFNKGPENIRDFLKQRRRIANGHLHLQHSQGYATSTMGPGLILKILGQELDAKCKRLKNLVQRKRYRWLTICLSGYACRGMWSLGVIGLEVWERLLGAYDFHWAKRNPVKWDIAATTKRLGR